MKWLLPFLILGTTNSLGWSLTLSDLLTRTRVYLRDTNSDPLLQRFSDTQLTRFFNDGQDEINIQTWVVISSTRINLLPGTTEYSLTSDFILPLRVTVNNRPIVERTFSFLDASQTDWVSSSGTPDSFYVRVDSSLVAGVSRESIGFVPVSTFSMTADVQFLANPVDLSASGDTAFGSDNFRLVSFHPVLCYYGAYRGFLAMGMVDEAALYYREYVNMTALMESVVKSRLSFNPSFRGVIQGPKPSQ